MEPVPFCDADRQQMEVLGISEDQVRRQLEIFSLASSHIQLHSCCTLGNGVRQIQPEDAERYLDLHASAVRQGRFGKFVPASGAATRMFQSLLQIYHMPQYLDPDELHRRVEAGVSVACDFLTFIRGIRCLAFVEDLERVVARDDHSLDALLHDGRYWTILEYLLTERGLNFGTIPKGLLKFHRYPSGCRTAFEEHLLEAVDYLTPGRGSCRVHFTIAPEYTAQFQRLAEHSIHYHGDRFGIDFDISFSFQKSSTNTIAVDSDNRLFRDLAGRLVFRPGGHGALIENLNELDGDLVYIKNVDNLIHEDLGSTSTLWKRLLGGFLVEAQDAIHGHLHRLGNHPGVDVASDAERFAREELLIRFPHDFETAVVERKAEVLFHALHRPIRVCGVVRNVGEPGGAPFWIKGRDGRLSLQIVEKAQVNMSAPEQQQIWLSSTHFNPVDLVCSLRDFEGRPFDLRNYVDPEAVFITRKSKDGRELKALELPGLWNGAMSDWITIVVDVPRITFNPVKTVFDLMRPEHQPADLR